MLNEYSDNALFLYINKAYSPDLRDVNKLFLTSMQLGKTREFKPFID
jgi:hypothetical protein